VATYGAGRYGTGSFGDLTIMATAWPPPGIPQPPFECAGIEQARALRGMGWTWRNPTNAERNLYFTPARCSRGHTVTGIIIQFEDAGQVYPFARCDAGGNETKHFLMLWPPYEWPEP
jgi:hypothetical protein